MDTHDISYPTKIKVQFPQSKEKKQKSLVLRLPNACVMGGCIYLQGQKMVRDR